MLRSLTIFILACTASLLGCRSTPDPAAPIAPSSATVNERSSTSRPEDFSSGPKVERSAALAAGGDQRREAAFRKPLIVGASVSAGYARTDDLSQTLEVVFGSDFDTTANAVVFANPLHALGLQLEYARRIEASMLIGVDLLFWFGFGPDRGTSRIEYVDGALALLDEFEGPIVIGDLPTIRDAHPRFLPPRWIPGDATIDRLNARIREWADARDRVSWLPLAGLVRSLKQGEAVEIAGRDIVKTPSEVFAWDRLHLSDEGGVMLTLLVADHLTERWPGGPELDLDPARVETRVRESRAR